MTIWTLAFEDTTLLVTNMRSNKVTNMRSNKGFRISQNSFGFHTFITFLKLGHKDNS